MGEQEVNYGSPAPRWLREAEVFNGWYRPWNEEITTKLKGFPLIVGVDHIQEWIDKAHQNGIRVIPYVTFYKAPTIEKAIPEQYHENRHLAVSPFYRQVDLALHPEWMLYREDGQVRRPFDRSDYPAGWQQVCTNAPGYQEASLAGAKALLEMGVDGLFIDNVHPHRECFGPQCGRHSHVQPEKNNEQTFRDLLQRVYELVKSYGLEKTVMLNSGGLDPAYWRYGDAMMYESYICTFTTKERRHDWAQIQGMGKACREAIEHGKVVVALSYVGHTSFPVKEDVFYCYACAKLSGFLWSDWFTGEDSGAQVLFSLRLGAPQGEMREQEGLFYRLFAHGLVVVNPGGEGKQVPLTIGRSESLRYVYEGTTRTIADGPVSFAIPAHSGRVYVWSRE